MWAGIEDAETVKAMRAAFEAGITTFDTAELYGEGHSEQIIGQALDKAELYGEGHSEQIIGQALSDVRSQVVYASKVFANHLKPELVIEACDRSLKNLHTDYIDLYKSTGPLAVGIPS
jgi:myo-inositol catabolism protein IolS